MNTSYNVLLEFGHLTKVQTCNGDDESESESDYGEYLARRYEKFKATVAGSIALELDNSNAKFQNDHLWYLSFDPFEKYTKEGEYCEDDLLSCLGCLELDGIFRFETQELALRQQTDKKQRWTYNHNYLT